MPGIRKITGHTQLIIITGANQKYGTVHRDQRQQSWQKVFRKEAGELFQVILKFERLGTVFIIFYTFNDYEQFLIPLLSIIGKLSTARKLLILRNKI